MMEFSQFFEILKASKTRLRSTYHEMFFIEVACHVFHFRMDRSPTEWICQTLLAVKLTVMTPGRPRSQPA